MRVFTAALLLCITGFVASIQAQDKTMGLIGFSDEAFVGYTLFSNNETSYLIDNCGLVVNTWTSNYKTGHGIYLLNNGDLLRAGALPGDFNAGGRGGIFELYSWDGELKWQYEIANSMQHAHHDLAVLPNGNFLCIVWERITEEEAGRNGRMYTGDVWSERIMEIEMIGNDEANIVWEWSIWDHLIQDNDPSKPNYGIIKEHPELLDVNYIGKGQETSGNWLHMNAISYNQEFDQIALSSRNLSEIYIIDHSATTAEAATSGGGRSGKGGDILFRYGNPQVYGHGNDSDQILHGQHHIDWVPDGTKWQGAFSVFNNEFEEGIQSNVIIFNNPADDQGNYEFDMENGYGDQEIIRTYTHERMYSDILSGVQVLPNNNLLILEGRDGHIREVNEEDQIVWEYINPVNRNGGPGIQGGTPRFNMLFRAIRYEPDFAGFDGKSLISADPIELLPHASDCYVPGSEVTNITRSIISDNTVEIVNTLIKDKLMVDLKFSDEREVWIFNTMGTKVAQLNLRKGRNIIPTSYLSEGTYILRSSGVIQKFIKH